MLSPTPPRGLSSKFYDTPLEYVYVVDEEAATRYRAAAVWQDYNIVPLTTGIADAETGRKTSSIVGYYDLNGRSITGKQGCSVIVRYSDGSTHKVIAR